MMTVQQNNHNCNNVKVADHVEKVIMTAENAPKKIWEYMIGYVLVFLVGMITIGIVGIIYIAWLSGNFNHIDQNQLKAAIINDQTSPFVGISFMIAGLGFSMLFGVVHWLIKLPNLRQQRSDILIFLDGGLGKIPREE